MKNYTMGEVASDELCPPVHIFSSMRRTREEPPHTHSFYELVYCLSGTVSHYVNDEKFTVGRGDILLIAPGDVHAFYPTESFAYFNVSLLETDEPITSCKASFFGAELKEIENILSAMMTEAREKKTDWLKINKSYADILIAKIRRINGKDAIISKQDEKCRAIAEYIDEHLAEGISLGELATRYYYNPYYMSRFFKEKFGCSLVEYVNRRRIEMAKELLTDGELTVSDICARIGFSCRSNFYTAFTKYAGCTPKEYKIKTAMSKKRT